MIKEVSDLEIMNSNGEYLKRTAVNVFFRMAIVVLSTLLVVNIFIESYVMVSVEFIILLLSIYGLFLFKKKYDIDRLATFALVLLFIGLLSTVIIRSAAEHTLLWALIFPFAAMMLKGPKQGLYYSIIFYVLHYILLYPYIDDTLMWIEYIRFVMVSIVFIAMAYIYESTSKYAFSRLNDSIGEVDNLNSTLEQRIIEKTKELDERVKLLHKLTENVPGAIFQYQLYPDGKVTVPYVSKGIENIYEVSAEEMIKDASFVFKAVHPDDVNMLEDSIKESAQTMQNWNLEYRINLPQKGLRWTEGHAKPEKLEDGSILWHGFINDITEQKKLEIKSLESEKNLRDIFDNAQSGLMYISGERTLIQSNQRLADIFGYDNAEEMIGLSMRELHLSEANYIEYGKLNFEPLRNGVKRYIEYELRSKDGSAIWCEMSGKAIDDNIPADMSKGVLWTVNDISERIELRKIQVFLQERLSYAIEGSNDGLWDWNIQTNEIYFSPRWKEIVGYCDNELKNEYIEWESRVHPDDLNPALIEYERFLASTDLENHYSNTFRMQHKDGHYVPILSRAKKVLDDNNEVERLVGTHVDMTELYAVQDAYKQERDRSELYLDTAEVLLLALDNNGRVTMLNRKGEELLGYKEEELLGKVWFEVGVLPEDIALNVKDFFNNIITINELPKEELQHHLISKSGEKLMFSFRTSFLFDNENKCLGILSSGIDITQKLMAEEELAKQHKYLQSIIDGVDDPIMVIKEDYTVEVMNNSLKKSLHNLNLADPENPKCYEISHHRTTPCDGLDHPCPLRDVLETQKHTTVIHKHDTKDGEQRSIELSASPLFDVDKNCIGIIESARDITRHLNTQDELKEQKSILDHQAHHDSLTGLPNRALFHDRLEKAIETAKRNQKKIALLFIDLDHFKEINDSLGHNFGDEILKTVSSRLQEVIREQDTVARLGGDEFTVVLEDLVQVQDASLIANKILDTLSKSFLIDDNTLYISCSIGISVYPDDGASSVNLLKFADSAMYKAKDEGRNNFQYYNSTMTELAFERVVMETSLRVAIENKEFVVYYQPQMNGATDKLIGMEALVRWQHPTMGLVSPAKFIPLAESTGLIVELDRYVMKTAMTQLSQWYKDGLNPGVLAMNLAVKQLKQDDFIDTLQNLIKETGCKSEWLEMEVTESQVMSNPEEAIKTLQKISDIGIELAVDDFGTGYSSLAYLKRLPIDKLKIDQAFIRDLPDDEEDAAIARAVIALAKSLNLRVIAEGVETKEQRDFIVENGCENIQGYYYSKPVPADEFEIFLKEKKL